MTRTRTTRGAHGRRARTAGVIGMGLEMGRDMWYGVGMIRWKCSKGIRMW